MSVVKVTEALRKQWALQRAQLAEERTHDQSGRPLSAEAIREADHEIEHMDHLLSLPIGSPIR